MLTKKRLSHFLLSIITFILLVGCSSKMSGKYTLDRFMFEGMDLGVAKQSTLEINGINNNAMSTFTFIWDEFYDVTTGVINEDSKTDEYIRYKFWTKSHYGNFFNGNEKYIYLYYYPKTNEIKIRASDDVEFWFSK